MYQSFEIDKIIKDNKEKTVRKPMKLNQIYHGDNLHFMPDMADESIDLIYIDPPFGTQSLWKSKAFNEKVQELQFYDIFGGGVAGYLNFMVERLRHMHRLLKPTGSIFVHLDWRMGHYVKVELDKIFGMKNFVNEIIWHYKKWSNAPNNFQRNHDTIFYYCRNQKLKTFNPQYQPYANEKWIETTIRKIDENGRLVRVKDENGNYLKRKSKNKGVPMHDVFHDISFGATSKERLGYPTQKPIKLLERIIKASSNEGDIVLDAFCGCGTAIDAAHGLNRKWIGIDASQTACEAMQKRMKDQHSLIVPIDKKPMTAEEFKSLDPLKFEKAAVRHIGGVTNTVQIGDGGVDGRLAFDGTPIQVKKHDKPIGDTDQLRAFYQHIKQHGRGIVISLNGFTKPAKQRANEWRNEGLDVQLLDINDVLAGKVREKPKAA